MTTTTTPELIHLDPTAIEIEDNVRLDPRLDRDFLASIEEHGVLIPVLAVRIEGQDKPVVREGQRRTFPGKLVCCAYWRCVDVFA